MDSTDVGGKITTAAGGKDKIVRCSVRELHVKLPSCLLCVRAGKLCFFLEEGRREEGL